MSLLKELHHRLVTTRAPWFSPTDADSAHLISRIVVEEESDQTEEGSGYQSHFELYLSEGHDSYRREDLTDLKFFKSITTG